MSQSVYIFTQTDTYQWYQRQINEIELFATPSIASHSFDSCSNNHILLHMFSYENENKSVRTLESQLVTLVANI
jgi:hypothetical protein